MHDQPRYHTNHQTNTSHRYLLRITADAAGDVTGNPLDALLFEIELDDGTMPDIHFRYQDLVLLEEHEAGLVRE